MTGREKAYELFAQGYEPDDPEVVKLGLSPMTRRRYYRDWKRLDLKPEPSLGPSPMEPKFSINPERAAAYEQFELGRAPGDFHVVALGLDPSTLAEYWDDWNRLQGQEPVTVAEPQPTVIEEAIAAAAGTPITALQPGQLFDLDGRTYRLRSIGEESATVIFLEWAPSGQFRVEKYMSYLPLNTLVESIAE